MIKNTELITVVWGVMTPWYLKAGVPSLLQPNNIPAVKDAIAQYTIYTDDEDQLNNSLDFLKLKQLVPIEIKLLPKGRDNVNACYLDAIERDFKNQWYTCIIQAEAIYGDASIKGIINLCQKNIDLILVGFPRTKLNTIDIVSDIIKTQGFISNRQLVKIAMENIHDETISPYSGVRITKLENTIWRVSHGVPNPTFKPCQEVVDYIRNNTTQNSGIDHILPMIYVKRKATYRYISESDEFFMIEPTDRSVALCKEGARPPDFGSKGLENVQFWLKMVQYWRAEQIKYPG